MKKFQPAVLILVLSFLLSCGKSDNKPPETSTPPSNTNTPPTTNNTQISPPQTTTPEQSKVESKNLEKKPEVKSEEQKTPEGIRVNFPVGSNKITLNGKMSGFGNNITYVFAVKKGQKLTASVMPATSNGNIQIEQIFTPSGKADGPFGSKINYSLTETGDWKLVLGENQMAGDPWTGTYFLTIEII